MLSQVEHANYKKLRALQDFILLKEQHIARHLHVKRSLQAIKETLKLVF